MTKVTMKQQVYNIMSNVGLTAEEKNEQISALLTQAKKPRTLTFKVSEKGAVCVIGLQRFPVTLYPNQWARLVEALPALEIFIEQNKDKLKFEKEVATVEGEKAAA